MNSTTRVWIALPVAGVIATGLALYSLRGPRDAWVSPPAEVEAAAVPASTMEALSIGRGDTLDGLLGRADLVPAARAEVLSAVTRVFDVRKLRAGSQLTLTRGPAGELETLEYVIDPDSKLSVSRSAESYDAAIDEIPGSIRVAAVCGTVRNSLFESMERAGERAELALQVAEIFAWDMDFNSDPQPGDEFCLVLEKKEYENDQPPTYRRILAARYDNAGTVYQGYLFSDGPGKPAYYSQDGVSLQSSFLRSPLRFEARVSSRFSPRRLHPVLKVYRPHLGTDYAAPTGSPVQAVASGRVTFSGYSGNSGNMVGIQHAGGYESMYLHLSRRFVRTGQRVEQGQRIGLVGATGLATGPHLDFRLRRNGTFVDFERLKAPRVTRIADGQMAAFAADRDRFAGMIEAASQSKTVDSAGGTAPMTDPSALSSGSGHSPESATSDN